MRLILAALLLLPLSAYAEDPLEISVRQVTVNTDVVTASFTVTNVSKTPLRIAFNADQFGSIGTCRVGGMGMNTDAVTGLAVGYQRSSLGGAPYPGNNVMDGALRPLSPGQKILASIQARPCDPAQFRGEKATDVAVPIFVSDGAGKGNTYVLNGLDVPLRITR